MPFALRKPLVIAVVAAAIPFNSPRAQTPPASAPQIGISDELAARLREQAAQLDKVKNVLPHVEALSQIVREGLPGISKVITGETADKVKEAITGVEAPNIAVTNTINDIIKTSRMLDNLGGEWRKAPAPELSKTPEEKLRDAAVAVKGVDCSRGAAFICNPLTATTNECTGGSTLTLPGSPTMATSAFIAECDRIGASGNVISAAVIPRERLRHITRDAQGPIYNGAGYATLCRPCAPRKCLFGLCAP